MDDITYTEASGEDTIAVGLRTSDLSSSLPDDLSEMGCLGVVGVVLS